MVPVTTPSIRTNWLSSVTPGQRSNASTTRVISGDASTDDTEGMGADGTETAATRTPNEIAPKHHEHGNETRGDIGFKNRSDVGHGGRVRATGDAEMNAKDREGKES